MVTIFVCKMPLEKPKSVWWITNFSPCRKETRWTKIKINLNIHNLKIKQKKWCLLAHLWLELGSVKPLLSDLGVLLQWIPLVLRSFVGRDTMTFRLIPTDSAKLMRLKCDFVNILLIATNGQTMIPIEKATDEKKRSLAWCQLSTLRCLSQIIALCSQDNCSVICFFMKKTHLGWLVFIQLAFQLIISAHCCSSRRFHLNELQNLMVMKILFNV